MEAEHRIACLEALRAIASATENSYVSRMPEGELERTQQLAQQLYNELTSDSTLVALVAALALVRTLATQACDTIADAQPTQSDRCESPPKERVVRFSDDEVYALACAGIELLSVLGDMCEPQTLEEQQAFDSGRSEIVGVIRRHEAASVPLFVGAASAALGSLAVQLEPSDDETMKS